jgi:hypothetical protein
MSDRRISDDEIDDGLRRSFSGDLPPEVETMLAASLRAFRREAGRPDRTAREHVWPAWRAAAALASLAAAILGATLHSGRTATAFADSIELWQRQARVIQNLGRADEMEARVDALGLIRWHGGSLSADPAARSLEELGAQLEPRTLARRLQGDWRRKDRNVYEVSPPDGSAAIEVSVDPETDLPVRLNLEQRGLSVQLSIRWTLRPVESVLASMSRNPARR